MLRYQDLLYAKWIDDFCKASRYKVDYCATSLDIKVEVNMLFEKAHLIEGGKLGTNYYSPLDSFMNFYPQQMTGWFYPGDVGTARPKKLNKFFQKDPADFIKDLIVDLMKMWLHLPSLLKQFFILYKKFNLSLDEAEFVYLDFWLQIPLVLDDLIKVLVGLDSPLRDYDKTGIAS